MYDYPYILYLSKAVNSPLNFIIKFVISSHKLEKLEAIIPIRRFYIFKYIIMNT
jgi:hypothetical protein